MKSWIKWNHISNIGNSTPSNEQVLHSCGLLPRTFYLFCQLHGGIGMGDYMDLGTVCSKCGKILKVVPAGSVLVWEEKEDV